MRAVWSGPKTVIAWSHQQFVRVICATGVVGHAIGGAVGWEWSRCWRWVGAAIGGTQVVQLELSGVVGSEPNVVHHPWWGHCQRWHKLSVQLSVVWSQPNALRPPSCVVRKRQSVDCQSSWWQQSIMQRGLLHAKLLLSLL
jgi:hypothetical protein